jgi:hypothetical protein
MGAADENMAVRKPHESTECKCAACEAWNAELATGFAELHVAELLARVYLEAVELKLGPVVTSEEAVAVLSDDCIFRSADELRLKLVRDGQ